MAFYVDDINIGAPGEKKRKERKEGGGKAGAGSSIIMMSLPGVVGKGGCGWTWVWCGGGQGGARPLRLSVGPLASDEVNQRLRRPFSDFDRTGADGLPGRDHWQTGVPLSIRRCPSSADSGLGAAWPLASRWVGWLVPRLSLACPGQDVERRGDASFDIRDACRDAPGRDFSACKLAMATAARGAPHEQQIQRPSSQPLEAGDFDGQLGVWAALIGETLAR